MCVCVCVCVCIGIIYLCMCLMLLKDLIVFIFPVSFVKRHFLRPLPQKQMQRIILHCFNSVKHKLMSKIGYFDLYGLDFMIDTDLKVGGGQSGVEKK